MSQPDHTTVDLTNCDREPIQFLGHVQDFGCLLALSSDWMIRHASANTEAFLGRKAEDLVGTHLSELLGGEGLHHIRGEVQVSGRHGEGSRIFAVDALGDGQLFDLMVNVGPQAIIVEFERAGIKRRTDTASTVRSLIARLSGLTDERRFFNDAARCVQALTGFDRVMVYQFHEDDTGEVVGEATTRGMDPFVGLRYPASDIPKQARALYLRNRIRLIADVDAPTHGIVPRHGADGQPLDLSMAATRAVSPIHIEYLKNMGVCASMSISIIVRGKLWGLIACHGKDPRAVDVETRTAAELFGQLFSYELAQKWQDAELSLAETARELHNVILATLSSGNSLSNTFSDLAGEISEVIPHDGIVLYSEGAFEASGSTPTREEFLGLARFLNTAGASRVFATDHLAGVYDRAASFGDRAAGVLALPVSRSPRDYIVLFRRPIAQTVTWAGNPEKPVETGPHGIRLTPRKSFEAWQEVVHDRSRPWRERELRAAESLRVTLLEVVLKMSDDARQERERASNKQDLLISELNHRVRNILNLIQGLVVQSRSGVASVEQFTDVLGGRIQALARAHDQLTVGAWGALSLAGLIRTETLAFIGEKASRIRFQGDDVMLEPQGFSTLALVFHELVTNSAKYGALSDSHGTVTIRATLEPDGALSLDWTERDGPPVAPPTRRGFGSTIIERSIPFELHGKAELDYALTGFKAHFGVPSRFVAGRATEEASLPATGNLPEGSAPARLGGVVMLLEDNLIISMDAQQALLSLGADEVVAVPSVDSALAELKSRDVTFALLDVNLGSGTSLAVARVLSERKIPFIFATGYGAEPAIVEEFPHARFLTKPYDAGTIGRALDEIVKG
ncbi:HWE histidine kinase domain-containing protein [Tropicimonas sp. IMCC34011]|uniref:HWE histidine kinase domain-containing protein n=1 Tax=Tropicimonas sp. IMCC34011 TaxID=2248759 RepID=UPI001E3C4FE8|nr:HWE histidine kinase domain-containing protein [Tropicimonas sp. IMCC34011]